MITILIILCTIEAIIITVWIYRILQLVQANTSLIKSYNGLIARSDTEQLNSVRYDIAASDFYTWGEVVLSIDNDWKIYIPSSKRWRPKGSKNKPNI